MLRRKLITNVLWRFLVRIRAALLFAVAVPEEVVTVSRFLQYPLGMCCLCESCGCRISFSQEVEKHIPTLNSEGERQRTEHSMWTFQNVINSCFEFGFGGADNNCRWSHFCTAQAQVIAWLVKTRCATANYGKLSSALSSSRILNSFCMV